MRGKSTLKNLLSFDAHIVYFQLSKHPFDVVTFDFKKAFEKVPYDVLQELAVRGISGLELHCLRVFVSKNASNSFGR